MVWNDFLEPEEIVTFPPDKALKYIIESSSTITSSRVRCVFGGCVKLRFLLVEETHRAAKFGIRP